MHVKGPLNRQIQLYSRNRANLPIFSSRKFHFPILFQSIFKISCKLFSKLTHPGKLKPKIHDLLEIFKNTTLRITGLISLDSIP